MMFKSLFATVLSASLFAGAFASPVDLTSRTNHVSFNNWGGFSSLNNFDNFYGVGHFANFEVSQTIVQEQQLVCRSIGVEIIQQRLLILQEMAKRIITEQICEVETQTIVFQQFHAGLGHFNEDLRRVSGHVVGFDSAIADHFGSIVGVDGLLTTDDFGFTGQSLGQSTVVVGGSNWNDATSFTSVDAAFQATQGLF